MANETKLEELFRRETLVRPHILLMTRERYERFVRENNPEEVSAHQSAVARPSVEGK